MTTAGLLVSLFGLSLTNLHNMGYKEEQVLSFGEEITRQATEYLKVVLSGKWLHPSNTTHLHRLFMEKTFMFSSAIYLLLLLAGSEHIGLLCDYLHTNLTGLNYLYLLSLVSAVSLYAVFSMKFKVRILEEVFLRLSQILVLPFYLFVLAVYVIPVSAIGLLITSLVLLTAFTARLVGGVGLLGYFISVLGTGIAFYKV